MCVFSKKKPSAAAKFITVLLFFYFVSLKWFLMVQIACLDIFLSKQWLGCRVRLLKRTETKHIFFIFIFSTAGIHLLKVYWSWAMLLLLLNCSISSNGTKTTVTSALFTGHHPICSLNSGTGQRKNPNRSASSQRPFHFYRVKTSPAHLVLLTSGGPGGPVPPSPGRVSSTLMWYSVSGSRCHSL